MNYTCNKILLHNFLDLCIYANFQHLTHTICFSHNPFLESKSTICKQWKIVFFFLFRFCNDWKQICMMGEPYSPLTRFHWCRPDQVTNQFHNESTNITYPSWHSTSETGLQQINNIVPTGSTNDILEVWLKKFQFSGHFKLHIFK